MHISRSYAFLTRFLLYPCLSTFFVMLNAHILELTANQLNGSTYLIPNVTPSPTSDTLDSSSGYRQYCATSKEWNTTDLDLNDCQSAVEYFYFEEMATRQYAVNEEFLSPGARAKTRLKTQHTPRKYMFSKSDYCL